MYDEDHVVGPLTLRQTLIAGVGIGTSVGIYYFVPEYMWLIALIAPLVVVLVWRYRAHFIDDPKGYFMNHPNGKKRLIRMIAEVESRTIERKTLGKQADPVLNATLDTLKDIRAELERLERMDR
jgi:hypothetical protein